MTIRPLPRSCVLGMLLVVSTPAAASPDPARPVGGPDPEIAAAVSECRALLRQEGEDQAGPLAERLVERAARRYGPDSIEVAAALSASVESRLALRHSPDAVVTSARRALAILDASGVEGVPLAAGALDLGRALERAGRLDEAAAAVARGLGALESTPDAITEARLLAARARIRDRLGDDASSRADLERAIERLETEFSPERPADLALARDLALALAEAGAFERASATLQRAIERREAVADPEDPDAGFARAALAHIAAEAGEFVRARKALEDLLEALDEAAGGHAESRLAYRVVFELASTLRQMRDRDGAILAARRAIELGESLSGPESLRVMRATLLYGNSLIETRRRVAEGAEALERSLAIGDRLSLEDDAATAPTANSLGVAYMRLGRFADAIPLFERSLRLWRRDLGERDRLVGMTLHNLGTLSFLTGNADDGERYYREVAEIREATYGNEHLVYAETLQQWAQQRAFAGLRDARTFELAVRAERAARRVFRQIASEGTETTALQFNGVRVRALDSAVDAASGPALDRADRARALDTIVRSRGIILDETIARRRVALESADGEAKRLLDAFDGARNELAAMISQGPAGFEDDLDAYLAAVAEAEKRRNRAEAALATKSVSLRRALDRDRVGATEVAAAIPERTALVSFVTYVRLGLDARSEHPRPIGESRYTAFVLRHGDPAPTIVPLGDAEGIDARVWAWQEAVGERPPRPRPLANRALADYREVGTALREAIWDPLLDALGNVDHVLVVPDGAIHVVSFASLPTGDDAFLVETGPTVHYLDTERDLTRAGPAQSPEDRFVGIGGAAFGGTETPSRPAGECVRYRDLWFGELPASAAEVERLAELWRAGSRPAEVVSGASATEAEVRAAAPRASVLHVATHGFVGIGGCYGDDAGPEDIDEEEMALLRNPLLRSGIALSGANVRDDATGDGASDGILTAEEFASLDLTRVRWAVLSACSTGRGFRWSAEGVFGLRRAVRAAGASTIVMSLWQVEDVATRDWMERLYRERLGGSTTRRAVHDATAGFVEERRRRRTSVHPFYWGAFVAAGDWR